MTRRPRLLVPLLVGLGALVGFGWIWIAVEMSDAPTSTVSWFVSESALVLAILVPAICLFFVVRALHARSVEARNAASPASSGVRRGSEMLWSLSNGLLPQAVKSSTIPTDATELVFVADSAVIGRHRQSAPATRTLVSSARAVALSTGSTGSTGTTGRSTRVDTGWGMLDDVTIAATDRRIVAQGANVLIDIPYADITAVHLVPGAVVLRLREGPPQLVVCKNAESIAVLAVWGSAGETALKRHPDFSALRTF